MRGRAANIGVAELLLSGRCRGDPIGLGRLRQKSDLDQGQSLRLSHEITGPDIGVKDAFATDSSIDD